MLNVLKDIYKKRAGVKSHVAKLGPGGKEFLVKRRSAKSGEEINFRVKYLDHPIFLRADTSDIATFYQCIYHKEYDIDFNGEPKVIVDLGANIGLTSVFFKSKYKDAKIIAVEPESSNFMMLQKNLKNYTDTNTYKAGVWNKNANLVIEDKGLGHYGFVVRETESKTENSFEAISLQQIIEENEIDTIDILKIDIEGSEKKLMDESAHLWLPKVNVLIIELHDRMESGCSQQLFKTLQKYNFTMLIKGENLVFYFQHALH